MYLSTVANKGTDDIRVVQIFLASSVGAIQVMAEELSTLDISIAESLQLARSLLTEGPEKQVLEILKQITRNFLETHKSAVGLKLYLKWRKASRLICLKIMSV